MFMDCEQANKYTHHAALLTRMLNFLPNRTFQFTMLITTSDSYLYKYCIWWNASKMLCKERVCDEIIQGILPKSHNCLNLRNKYER